MISNSREAKQEGETNDVGGGGSGGGDMLSKGPSSSSVSRQWSSSGFRNPRIVRVSRSFGGKDRHSKVCTVRGLRDRRIRLSVPTAIQLYDLQERLGVGQPSKVVDWLLEATKDDIDKLPPLQMPLGFNQFHQPLLLPHESNPNPTFFDPNPMKDDGERDKGKWIKVNEDHENHGGNGNNIEDHQRLFPLTNQSPFPGLLNNGMPLNSSYYQWEPSNLSLSTQFGGNHGLVTPLQTENFFNGNTTSVPSPTTVQSSATMASFFPTYPLYGTNPDGNDSRQMNYLQLLSSNFLSNSAAMRNFSRTQNDHDGNHGDDRDDIDS